MVSAKDDSLPTDTVVLEAEADEAVASQLNGHDAEVRSTRSKIRAVFDRKTYELALPVDSARKSTEEL